MKIYRVTEVLKCYSSLDRVPEQVLRAASERGTWVHAALSAHLNNLYFPPVASQYIGYIDSFFKFLPLVRKIIAVEKRFTDGILGFSGTVDLLAEIEGRSGTCVVDWKTPIAAYRTWACQCAAYKALTKADNCGTLRLNADGGTPKMDWWEGDIQALPAFLSALNAHRYLMGEEK